MIKLKFVTMLLAPLAVALGVGLVFPAVASANPTPPRAGEFCADADHNRVIGDVKCTEDRHGGRWRWIEGKYPSTSPSASASPSTSVSRSAPVPSASAPSASAGAGSLPVTGAREDAMAVGGLGLILAGSLGIAIGRRRRTRFTA